MNFEAFLAEGFHAPPQVEDTSGGAFDAFFDRVAPSVQFKGTYTDDADRKRKRRQVASKQRREDIAILDFETDPFDNETQEYVHPFLAVLYSDHFEPIVIWEEDHDAFIARIFETIEGLPRKYTIYAHNGGKFDFLFLLHRLRGSVSFKGRGIMSAKISGHELRDSFLIIPERLANYKKTTFDYNKLRRTNRHKWRDEIISYCIDDCRDLLEIVKAFIDTYGFKLTIGQAALHALKKEYNYEHLGSSMDEYLRQWYYGGRVECIEGRGVFDGDYKLFDINSAYPFAMATKSHPIGADYVVNDNGDITADTIFLEIECDNQGALIGKDENGELTTRLAHGRFKTTIWEYETAKRFGLINNVHIHLTVDNPKRTDFRRFIEPLYRERQETKSRLQRLKLLGIGPGCDEYDKIKQRDMILKLTQNSCYGKFAQNPRKYEECYLTDLGQCAPDGTWALKYERSNGANSYAIWSRPNPGNRFNNVGTAASITGAVRAQLMEALHGAIEPIYCDTDSIICRDLPGVSLSATELGAWDLEAEFDKVLIAGKKLYAAVPKGKTEEDAKIRSKGTSGVTLAEMECMLHGALLEYRNPAPTFDRRQRQTYITRRIKATAPIMRKMA